MKIGIVTITDNNNYGNRLQCYALYKTLKNMDNEVKVINNDNKNAILQIKRFIKNTISSNKNTIKRRKNFKKFNKRINSTKYVIDYNKPEIKEKFDYLIVGSDQVWNPNYERLSKLDTIDFKTSADKISYAASFGVSDIVKTNIEKLNKLNDFKAISVREFEGAKILNKYLPDIKVNVNVDPTLLLNRDEWEKVIERPKKIQSKKYILVYFLGNLKDTYKLAIKKFAEDNDCDIINILDKNAESYTYGPAEFLYLEKNAFLICTDSFHSSVFAFIFNKPFVVFDRDGKKNTSSRIDTLINKFSLDNRKFNGSTITKENLTHDYSNAYEILKIERKKSDMFLRKALNIKESE